LGIREEKLLPYSFARKRGFGRWLDFWGEMGKVFVVVKLKDVWQKHFCNLGFTSSGVGCFGV